MDIKVVTPAELIKSAEELITNGLPAAIECFNKMAKERYSGYKPFRIRWLVEGTYPFDKKVVEAVQPVIEEAGWTSKFLESKPSEDVKGIVWIYEYGGIEVNLEKMFERSEALK